jgi:hypothetical protein
MSRFAIVPTEVLRHPALTPQDKLVLTVLSSYADTDGYCWPSVATLSADSGLSERSVQYALRHLQEVMVVEVKRYQREDGGQGSNSYWVRGFDRGTVQLVHQGGAQLAGAPPQEVHPNSTSKNRTSLTTTTTTTAREAALRFDTPDAQDAYEAYRRAHRHPGAFDSTLRALQEGMTSGQAMPLEAIGRALLELQANGEAFNVSRLRGYLRGLDRAPAAPTTAGGYKRRGGPVDEAAMTAKVDAILAERGVTL